MASFVLFVLCRVKDHHMLLHCSPLLKKTCIRQVVLDERLPLNIVHVSCVFQLLLWSRASVQHDLPTRIPCPFKPRAMLLISMLFVFVWRSDAPLVHWGKQLNFGAAARGRTRQQKKTEGVARFRTAAKRASWFGSQNLICSSIMPPVAFKYWQFGLRLV